MSNCEFQLPVAPSVGDQAGKQSCASSKVRLRTMVLLAPSSIRVSPISFAPRSPMIVVFGPTLICVCRVWFCTERTRASSSGPLGATRPQTAGSYVARYAARSYSGSARSSQVSRVPSGPSKPLMVPLT